MAYALILTDVYRWITNRTDLFGIAKEMVLKSGIVLSGSICETLTVRCTDDVIGRTYAKYKTADYNHAIRCVRKLRDQPEGWHWMSDFL